MNAFQCLVLVVEAVRGPEQQPRLFPGSPSSVSRRVDPRSPTVPQRVGAARQERGGPPLMASELGDGDADALGQQGLAQALLLTQRGEAFREVHVYEGR